VRTARLLGPLAERAFRRLYLARASSLFGDGLVQVALAFAVLRIDRSASALGLVLAARSLSVVVFLLVAGVVADRLPRQLVMVGADLLRLATQGLSAALLIAGRAQVWELGALAFAYGIGQAFFLPASTGLIPQTVSPGRLQEANALINLTSSGFSILGPAVAGVLVATVGPGWALAVDAGSFAASAAFLTRVRVAPRAAAAPASFLSELRAGWHEFRSRTWLWVDGVFSALGNFAILSPLWVLGPVVAESSLGGASAWAAIATAFGAGAVLGGLCALRLKPRFPLRVGVPVLALLALPPALLAVPAPTVAIAGGALAGGFGLSLFNTLFETAAQQHVPLEALSRVASIDWGMSMGLQPLAFVVVGPVADRIGTGGTLAGSAGWAVLSTAVVLAVPSVRALRSREAAAPAAAEIAVAAAEG
jgi:MFS family permease